MNICLDLSAGVHHRAGIGRFSQELVSALVRLDPSSHYSVFYNRPRDARPDPPVDRLPTLTVPWGDKHWRLRVLASQMTGRSQDRVFPGIELFHGTDHLLPRLARAATVFTLYDLTYLLTDTHTTLNRLFLRLMMPYFLRNAGAIIAISESTRRDMLRHYKIDDARVRVIHGGVAPRFRPASPAEIAQVRQRHNLSERFILTVGTIEPRKNMIRLLEVYRWLRDHNLNDRTDSIQLVIAGARGWRCDDFFQRLQEIGLTNEVVLLGRFPDAELPALYSAAEVFAFPSLYEGFGLPVLEAMACGTPVVASNTSAIPEIASNAGILFDPYNTRDLAEAILKVLNDVELRAEMRGNGLARANHFTWQKTAEATLALYRSVLQNRRADRIST